jgi:hypothetical protein
MAEDNGTAQFMRDVAEALDKLLNGEGLPPRNGFVLLVFPFNGPVGARTNYISNADRETMLTGFKEIIARFEGRYHEGNFNA